MGPCSRTKDERKGKTTKHQDQTTGRDQKKDRQNHRTKEAEQKESTGSKTRVKYEGWRSRQKDVKGEGHRRMPAGYCRHEYEAEAEKAQPREERQHLRSYFQLCCPGAYETASSRKRKASTEKGISRQGTKVRKELRQEAVSYGLNEWP
jgi:hypothetical protein